MRDWAQSRMQHLRWIQVWPECATDEELDTATEAQWTELETTSVHTGVILESWTAEAGKAFMAANCVNAPTGYYYGCVSKLRQAMAEAEMMESCAGLQGDGETPFCHSWPMLMNETCAIKLGSSLLGVQEAVMEAIYSTGNSIVAPEWLSRAPTMFASIGHW